MSHPKDTNYPILRTTSKSDGTPIQTILDSIPGQPFRIQNSISQDGLAIVIDDGLGLSNWGGYIALQSRLNEFKFNGGDKPSYVPNSSHNTSYEEAKTIIKTTGASGTAWSAPPLPVPGS